MSYSHIYVYAAFLSCSCTSQKKRFIDEDQDGFAIEDGDCDDNNATIYPNAEEICDGIDNNCNDDIDENSRLSTVWYQDADGDGIGGYEVVYSCLKPAGYVSQSGDCDDENPNIPVSYTHLTLPTICSV